MLQPCIRLLLGITPNFHVALAMFGELLDSGCPPGVPLMLSAQIPTELQVEAANVNIQLLAELQGVLLWGIDTPVGVESKVGYQSDGHQSAHFECAMHTAKSVNLIDRLKLGCPGVYQSLLDEHVCLGKVMVLMNLAGLERNEVCFGNLVLQHAKERFHLLDLG